MFFSRVNFNLTKLTSASKLCIWNAPFGCKVDTAPKGIKDISFDMHQHTKEGNSKKKILQIKENFLILHQAGQKRKEIHVRNRHQIHAKNSVISLKNIAKSIISVKCWREGVFQGKPNQYCSDFIRVTTKKLHRKRKQ